MGIYCINLIADKASYTAHYLDSVLKKFWEQTFYSLLVTRYFLHVTRYFSLLPVGFYLLLVTFYSPLVIFY